MPQTITRGFLHQESLSRVHLRQAAAGADRFAYLCERPAGSRDSGADDEHRAAASAGACGGTRSTMAGRQGSERRRRGRGTSRTPCRRICFSPTQRGAGRRYYDLGLQYLDDKAWFDPLSRNENVLNGRHAYSYVNSLSSAMMAYMVAGSEKHLRAAQNAFAMLEAAELCHRRMGSG